jgi:hypothetical protein
LIIIPFVCADREVQAYKREMLIGPYSVAEFQKTAGEPVDEAVRRWRRRDMAFWIR